MNRINKNIIRSFLFFGILIAVLVVLSNVFVEKSNKPESDMQDVTANGILGEKENMIDVLFLGDSEAYCTFSPMEMYDKYGFTSYVCGTSAQQLYYSDDFFKKAFEKQKPKVVVLETNAIYREFSIESVLVNKINNILPVFRYHNRWKSLNVNDFKSTPDYNYTDDLKGFNYNTSIVGTTDGDYMKQNDNAEKISKLNEIYVKRMIKYCKENNVEFILISSPSTVNWNYSRHLGIEKLAKENQVEYIDLNQVQMQESIDWSKDTKDAGDHLNYTGALKVTKYVGSYLSEKYNFVNNKSDKNYDYWNKALVRYKEMVLKEQNNIKG